MKFLGIPALILTLSAPAVSATRLPYCLSQVGAPSSKPTVIEPDFNRGATLDFQLRGTPYRIVSSRSFLSLVSQKSNKPVIWVNAPQIDKLSFGFGTTVGKIRDLKLDKYGWVFINGEYIDYYARLYFRENELVLGKPEAFPDLVNIPCNFLQDFLGTCHRVQGIYSNTLRQVFLIGYEKSFWGMSSLQTYTFISGKLTLLSTDFQGLEFIRDIPAVNGALFGNRKDKNLIFDGKKPNLLSIGFPVAVVETLNQKRAFLTNMAMKPQENIPRVFYELKPGPKLVSLSVPADFRGYYELFTLPRDYRLWALTYNSLFTLEDDRMRRVYSFPKPLQVISLWETSNGAVGFKQSLRDTSLPNYFLRRVSAAANCKIPLQLGQ